MKSKLFLSLSILTAVFSVKADALTPVLDTMHVYSGEATQAHTFVAPKLGSISKLPYNQLLNKKAAIAAIPFAGLVGATAATIGYLSYTQPVKPATYTDMVKNFANDAKVTVTNGFEKSKVAVVNGFNTAKNFTLRSNYHTAGVATGALALAYGAYKLYNTDFSGKAKQAPVQAPVVKRPQSPYCGRA